MDRADWFWWSSLVVVCFGRFCFLVWNRLGYLARMQWSGDGAVCVARNTLLRGNKIVRARERDDVMLTSTAIVFYFCEGDQERPSARKQTRAALSLTTRRYTRFLFFGRPNYNDRTIEKSAPGLTNPLRRVGDLQHGQMSLC